MGTRIGENALFMGVSIHATTSPKKLLLNGLPKWEPRIDLEHQAGRENFEALKRKQYAPNSNGKRLRA